MSLRYCRLCRSVVGKYAVSLRNPTNRLAERIQDLLDVTVVLNDSMPQHICEKCKRRVESLEKAAQDLTDFRSLARATLKSFEEGEHRGPLKRTRETSGAIGVSPDTQKARPPSKKSSSRRQLNFGQGRNINIKQ